MKISNVMLSLLFAGVFQSASAGTNTYRFDVSDTGLVLGAGMSSGSGVETEPEVESEPEIIPSTLTILNSTTATGNPDVLVDEVRSFASSDQYVTMTSSREIHFNLSETSRINYHSKSSDAPRSYIRSLSGINIKDWYGNKLWAEKGIINASGGEFQVIPYMNLPAGDYAISMEVGTTLFVTELSAVLAESMAAPEGENQVIITDFFLANDIKYGVGTAFIDGDIDWNLHAHGQVRGGYSDFIELEIKQDSIISLYNTWANASYDESVRLISVADPTLEYVVPISAIGWHSTDTPLPAGKYTIKNLDTTGARISRLSEIKATPAP